MRNPVTIRTAQSVYDLSVQFYGDIGQLASIVKLGTDLSNPVVGSTITPEDTTNFNALTLFSTQLIATADPNNGVFVSNFRITNLGMRIINTGDFRITT